MTLAEFSIRRPVTILMVCLIAILLGTIAFVQIPVDLMPEIEYPIISVNTGYEGVAPEEMETLIARPLEQALSSAPNAEENHLLLFGRPSQRTGEVCLRN